MGMMCMCCFGVGEMIGGLFIGYIIDITKSNKKASFVNIILIIIQTIISLFFLNINNYDFLALVMCFSWGF